jgi:hypothetical protein
MCNLFIDILKVAELLAYEHIEFVFGFGLFDFLFGLSLLDVVPVLVLPARVIVHVDPGVIALQHLLPLLLNHHHLPLRGHQRLLLRQLLPPQLAVEAPWAEGLLGGVAVVLEDAC